MRSRSALALLLFTSAAAAAPGGQGAHGTFDPKVTTAESAVVSRLTLEKTFHGDLEGTSSGQMLAWGTGQASGVYVAIEKVTGTLRGKRGTFILAHKGEMVAGKPVMEVTVAHDSGTEELAGLSGTMRIVIDKSGKHSYDFDYNLPQ